MFESFFKNQVLMSIIISLVWLVPGLLFTIATNQKDKNRLKEKQIKNISKLYPQP